MKRHTIRLYNLIFPIWIFWMVPSLLWLLLLPANFLWDSLVLLAAAGWLRLQGKKELWKRSIVKVWLIGFAADFAGAGVSTVRIRSVSFVTVWRSTRPLVTVFACCMRFPPVRRDRAYRPPARRSGRTAPRNRPCRSPPMPLAWARGAGLWLVSCGAGVGDVFLAGIGG